MSKSSDPSQSASLSVSHEGEKTIKIVLQGRLDAAGTSLLWQKVKDIFEKESFSEMIVEGSGIDYCDGSGTGLLFELMRRAKSTGKDVEIQNLSGKIKALLEQFDPSDFQTIMKKRIHFSLIEEVGHSVVGVLSDLKQLVTFVGELTVALGWGLMNPLRIRWKDTFLLAEKAGVNAIPIVSLVCFLMGLILAFQSAVPLKQFGADIFVATLVSVSMIRELGPLMTAILLAGRTGSAFAAEIGTMKVNEEVDALVTMGLDPVRFLTVTRVLAAVTMTPLLTLVANLMGIIGGAVVFRTFGFPLITYWNQVQGAIDLSDLLGGLAKAFVFGILVAGIGCLRGLQTKTGASAVGDSATRAVVSGIVLIVAADGIFSILYYYLGI